MAFKTCRHGCFAEETNERIERRADERCFLMKVCDSIDFCFGTKAETLENLHEVIRKDVLCEQYYFTVGEWSEDKDSILEKILHINGKRNIVVRSSAKNEDNANNSMAGYYHSVINVKPIRCDVVQAINDVVNSYKTVNKSDQVLIQPYISNSVISGVILTRDLDTGSEYYVVNYDDFSGRTDTVTSGAESKEILVYKNGISSLQSYRFKNLIEVVSEIELATGCDYLDIEFCITADDSVYILQVRRIAAKDNWSEINNDRFHKSLVNIKSLIRKVNLDSNGLSGNKTILGDMPDWNPAEIIGTSPKPLALSLYKQLITDEVWSEARAYLGYKNIGSEPLLIDIFGKPYIDVRKSLNSFLPENMSPDSAEILINTQLGILRKNRDLHDKIEFDVAITCCDFDYWFHVKKYELLGVELDVINEHYTNLHLLTKIVIENGVADISKQANKTIECANLHVNEENVFKRMEVLIESCKENGTVPFAILARHAFIAVSFLKSIVNNNAMTQDRVDLFMNSLQTISKKFVIDMLSMSEGNKSSEWVMQKYGHLRPGTYDITSHRYDENPELFFGSKVESVSLDNQFSLLDNEKDSIRKLISEFNYSLSPEELFQYIAYAIEAREKAKFEFTRVVSEILRMLTEWGVKNSIKREDISFVKISELLCIIENDGKSFETYVDHGKSEHSLTRILKLPELIFSENDVDIIRVPLCQPTFITSKSITTRAKNLTLSVEYDIEGCIILIESADPGFDWIFSYNISGLITKFGGANSHMAIRCAEFGLPAAIGCGERIFSEIETALVIDLNCDSRNIKVIS